MLTNVSVIISQYICVSNQAVHLKSVMYQLHSIKLGRGAGEKESLISCFQAQYTGRGGKGGRVFHRKTHPLIFFGERTKTLGYIYPYLLFGTLSQKWHGGYFFSNFRGAWKSFFCRIAHRLFPVLLLWGFGNVKITQASIVPGGRQHCSQGKAHRTGSGDVRFIEKVMTVIY